MHLSTITSISFYIFIALFLFGNSIVNCEYENGLNDRNDTLVLVSQLRSRIILKVPASSPISHFVEDDLYILQWLKANAFDVNQAESHFLEHLTWRRNYKIDHILQENWMDFTVDFPIFVDTVDKTGRPCAEVWLSDWNILRAIMRGRGHQIIRWQIYRLELQQKRLFDIRRDGNKNVTGAIEIQDFQGFNAWNQGCPPCLPVFMQMFLVWSKHYSGLTESIYMVNLGPSFYNLFRLLSRQIGPSLSNPHVLKLYQSKKEWLPVLDSIIERDQRSIRFGGRLSRKIAH